MGEFSKTVKLVARAAAGQGGVFSGDNPTLYNASDPIQLWVIQVVIIIAMTQLLSLLFARIRQPRVIAEVIGGILLGPTVMGRIPNFRATVFPQDAMPLLTLTSTIGLVLFLFLVGLEIDISIIKKNAKAAAIISVAGLVVPLGLGAALAVGVYKEFISDTVNFGYFILFVAVAIGITAFPVLCRILTELKLLDTTVGVVVLAAGVGNDVVGWILLALSVALANASTGLTALWVLLTAAGFIVFMTIPVRLAFVWLARNTGSLEQGSPTPLVMTVTLLTIFISAFFTDIIGIHPIFGGFLAGLIMPHENGFAISLVEKLEDLVSILFLPLYFTLSGLNTNLGLLDNGITWGYTILICAVAFFSKFLSCGLAAKVFGFSFREAGAIGSLMSCKGLVELIVLNVGLQAGILDTRTFSMFVVHAIILTFMTTPLTLLFYPAKYRVHEGGRTARDKPISYADGMEAHVMGLNENDIRNRFAIVLDRIEQLPSAMTLSRLLQTTSAASSTEIQSKTRISIDALRLIELTNRTSAVFKSHEAEALVLTDPILAVFRTFGYLNRLIVSTALSVVTWDDFSSAIASHVEESDSQMLIIPWSSGATTISTDETGTHNPFDGVFRTGTHHDHTRSVIYSEFLRNVFSTSKKDVALFVDSGLQMHHGDELDQMLFLPFFGGPDDRLALHFVVQLCRNSSVHATVIRINKIDGNDLSPVTTTEKGDMLSVFRQHHVAIAAVDTVYGVHNTETRLQSDTADNIAWEQYARSMDDSLSRIVFRQNDTVTPLKFIADVANTELAVHKNLIVVTGRSRRMAPISHTIELEQIVGQTGGSVGSSVPKTLGDVGAALVAMGTKASLLIMQSPAS